jgi:hypothetical protein
VCHKSWELRRQSWGERIQPLGRALLPLLGHSIIWNGRNRPYYAPNGVASYKKARSPSETASWLPSRLKAKVLIHPSTRSIFAWMLSTYLSGNVLCEPNTYLRGRIGVDSNPREVAVSIPNNQPTREFCPRVPSEACYWVVCCRPRLKGD